MSTSTWVAIIVPLLGFLGTVATIVASRRQDKATATKTSAEALQVVQETTLNLLTPMREQIERQEEKIRDLQARVEIVEDDRDLLAEAISIHVEWEDQGRPDPPGAPQVGPKVRAILGRLRAA